MLRWWCLIILVVLACPAMSYDPYRISYIIIFVSNTPNPAYMTINSNPNQTVIVNICTAATSPAPTQPPHVGIVGGSWQTDCCPINPWKISSSPTSTFNKSLSMRPPTAGGLSLVFSWCHQSKSARKRQPRIPLCLGGQSNEGR